MIAELTNSVECNAESSTLLIAPLSAVFLDKFVARSALRSDGSGVVLEKVWSYRQHLSLDDMDFGDDGIIPTLSRVIGRRGIGAWKVRKEC